MLPSHMTPCVTQIFVANTTHKSLHIILIDHFFFFLSFEATGVDGDAPDVLALLSSRSASHLTGFCLYHGQGGRVNCIKEI